MAEQTPRVPFDDRPALEELERLQRSIQEYRRKRERAEGEFEKFVGGFRPVAGQGVGGGGGVGKFRGGFRPCGGRGCEVSGGSVSSPRHAGESRGSCAVGATT